MAYMCRYMNKECDACGGCEPDRPACPECGSTDYEEMYYMGQRWIGCDECIRREQC